MIFSDGAYEDLPSEKNDFQFVVADRLRNIYRPGKPKETLQYVATADVTTLDDCIAEVYCEVVKKELEGHYLLFLGYFSCAEALSAQLGLRERQGFCGAGDEQRLDIKSVVQWLRLCKKFSDDNNFISLSRVLRTGPISEL